ncbi:Melatonin receptor type 1B [Boothiomyces sp. JEL0866]|nr:Melatonin receptor type 1B [Boothiomyces sp. JEL0866]
MDSISIQFQPGYDLTLSASVKIWMCVLFMFSSIGFLGSLLVIVSNCRQNINASIVLYLSLSFADMLYTFETIIVVVANLIHQEWAIEKTGAVLNYIVTIASIIGSATSLVLITIERYLTIANQVSITRHTAIMWIAVTWAISLLLPLIPIISQDYEGMISISASKMYCSFAFTSHQPVAFACVISLLLMLAIYVVTMNILYMRIIHIFLEKSNSNIQKRRLTDRDKELIKKAFVICLTFLLCWTPVAISIIYQEITQIPVSSNIDAFCGLMTVVNSVLNPFVLISLDNRIKFNVYTLLNIPVDDNSTSLKAVTLESIVP